MELSVRGLLIAAVLIEASISTVGVAVPYGWLLGAAQLVLLALVWPRLA